MTVHASGHGPVCALSENAKLPNMQVESLEISKDFELFIVDYTQAINKKKGFLRFGLTARISCLQIDRLINSSANSLKRCNENHMCWNRKCSQPWRIPVIIATLLHILR